jgi:hypothetical protein
MKLSVSPAKMANNLLEVLFGIRNLFSKKGKFSEK